MTPVRAQPPAEDVVATLYGVGDVRVESRPLPELGRHDVLVALRSVGVCGSDIHYFEHGRMGSRVVESPLVLGHEASGVIVDCGESARQHEIGQRVAIEPGVPCRRCRECRSGRYNLCRDMRFLATPPIDGAFRRFIAMPEDFVFEIPIEMSDDAGALLEPLSVGIWACKQGGVSIGDRVLVTGAGPIGNLAAQAACVAGAVEVTVADINADRLRRSASCSCVRTVTLRSGAVEGEFDVLLECTGSAELTAQSIVFLRPSGTAVLVGAGTDPDVSLPLDAIRRRELKVVGDFRYANTFPTAIALASSGRIDLEGLVDARFGLTEIDRALRATREDPSLLKVMVDVTIGT
ncbi:MAG: NAD(P)-dependent alcohol dehydrogenase [Actinomycetota bacterium]|jgi:L-iditol 2-dehydrogenase|nr:NAD(P)-dependent alcohol dehydrogenase [Actinomycetota bacterium]